ncbi:MAG: hydrogenase iron-sulfur subunit [Candidatus Thorarchaeota archaeon]
MDIYSILSHPFRRKILFLLEKEGYLPYTDLMEQLGLETTGQLNFHLRKIGSLISKDKKSYFLTEDGKRIIKILNLNKRILSGENIDEYFESKGSEINRIGVIICKCNKEISSVINIVALENYINKLKKVVSVKIFDNLCQEKNFDKISRWIKDNFINKIVIAACSPRTHQLLFERIFEDIIDRVNIEIANIREQCCWVHQPKSNQMDYSISLEKTKLLIEAAVERISLQKKVKIKRVEIEKSCAILGGGIAGITLALNLSRAGIKVYLIEKSPTLGGKVARWHRIHNMGDCSICLISELISELVNEKNIKIYTNTEIENVSGEVGNFTINLTKKPRFINEKKCTGCKQCIEVCSIKKPNQYEYSLNNRKIIYIPFIHSYPYIPIIDEEDIKNCLNCRICERACLNKAIDLTEKEEKVEIKVGTKVIAIGSDFYDDLQEYRYNPQKNIITSMEFERILSSDGITDGNLLRLSDKKPISSISIIQEVGPSKYLADYTEILAKKYIEDVKIKNPNCEVSVFYDLSKLKDKDEVLLRSNNPRFIYANKITIDDSKAINYVIADNIEFPSDLIVLNVKYVPNKDLKSLRKYMDFTLDDNGFMSEETLASGIYGVGTIFGPLDYHSTISTSNNIALKIISLLSKNYLIAEFSGIEINEDNCGLCSLCSQICPYNAITIESDKINIDKFKCKGCGTCASLCPTNAIDLNIDTSEKILETIKVFSKFRSHPKIIAFCCRSCGYAAADDAGLKKISYNPSTFIVQVPCTGRIDTNFIFKAFELGFDGVMVFGCRQEACRYIDGVEKLKKKITLLKKVINPKYKDRIMLKHMNAVEGAKFAEIINEFYNQLTEEVKFEA